MLPEAKQYVMRRIREAPVRQEPFPHILVEEVFPPDLYAEMQRHMPPEDLYQRLVDTGRVGKNYSPARLYFMPANAKETHPDSEIAAFWADFIAALRGTEFIEVWLQLFHNEIQRRIRQIDWSQNSFTVSLGSEMFLMRDKETYELGPHRDNSSKVVAALFYLPADDRDSDLGTSLYFPKQKDFNGIEGRHYPRDSFDLATTIPFRPNTLFAFPNTFTSYHGVEPVSGAHRSRDVLLYDIKFSKQTMGLVKN